MLETIRTFGLEQLAASGELPRTQRHHAAYFLALAEHIAGRLHGDEQSRGLQRLEREHDNIHAALSWLLREGEPRAGLRLAVALWWFWYVRGALTDGRMWLEAALARATDIDPGLRAQAHHALGVLAWRQGDFRRAADLGAEALRIAREAGLRWEAATALFLLEMIGRSQGDFEQAESLLGESPSLFREVNDTWGVASALLNLGTATLARGDYQRAVRLHEESLDLFRRLNDQSGVAAALYSLGLGMREQGQIGRAAALAEEALGVFRLSGDASRIAFALHLGGLVARATAAITRAPPLLTRRAWRSSGRLATPGGSRTRWGASVPWPGCRETIRGPCSSTRRALRLGTNTATGGGSPSVSRVWQPLPPPSARPNGPPGSLAPPRP